MPGVITNLGQGLPVEIGKIDRELKRLWQEGEGAATRASLINFAVYCEGAEMMRQSTEVISHITQDHACRAILIVVDPGTPGASVEAWISSHCHLSRAGAKQVCCEQISFLLGRNGQTLIPNIVFSHLDSDLPLVLWWRGEFPEESDEQLWTWVDRIIYDSQAWPHVATQFRLLRDTIVPHSPRMALCDLNWTRSLYLRQAVAQIFDLPQYAAELANLDSVEILHAPGMRSTAVLMAGWFGAQLQWKLQNPNLLSFHDLGGKSITVTLKVQPGPALGGVRINAGKSSFVVTHRDGSDFLYSDVSIPGEPECHRLMPGGKEDIVSLLNDELMSGGKHKVYLKAVAEIADAL